MLGSMLSKVALKLNVLLYDIKGSTELVQSEDRFTDVKDALKTLNKMDFDKLVASVRLPPS